MKKRISIKRVSRVALGMLLPLFVAWGCLESTSKGPPSYLDLVESGWTAFEYDDFGDAALTFLSAVALDTTRYEAFDGLGWSLAMIDSLAFADASLTATIERHSTLADAFAGRAAVRRDLYPDSLELAVTDAETALELAPDFVFGHNLAYDWHDIRLILAQALFGLTRFSDVEVQILILDPSFSPPAPTAEDYVGSLLAKLQQLESQYGGLQ